MPSFSSMNDILIYNKIKIYPDFKQVVEFKTPIVNLSALTDKINRGRKNQNNAPSFESLRRSKTAIRDIALCNDFELFSTFTFANDRQDFDKCLGRFKQWLKNQKSHSPDLAYLAVPELHKNKKGIHFHVLLKNYNGTLKKTKIRTKYGSVIYNIKGYRLGFTTAVRIGDSKLDKHKVASYITKYVTKELISSYNKKRYWCSKGLIRPEEYSNIPNRTKYFQSENVVFENDFVRVYKIA